MSTDLLADPAWLADRLDDPAVRVVDVREPWEYDAMGHLPGAVSIPFDSYRNSESPDPGTLPGADTFADLLEAERAKNDEGVAQST